MISDKSRMMASLLGGAIGDAFGAPLEGIRELKNIIGMYGSNGLQEFVPYKSFWDDCEPAGIGVITDDTTMTVCTFAGIVQAQDASNKLDAILDAQWQNYLMWGSHQQYGEELVSFVYPQTLTPEYLKPFLFRCGAGKNTIAALLEGRRGDLDNPLEYSREIAGKTLVSPNAGCGSMMRIAPIAYLHDEIDVVQLARRNAAITHGHVDAINATAVIADLVSNALQKDNLSDALNKAKGNMQELPYYDGVMNAWKLAEQAFIINKNDMGHMDELGYKMGKNPFLALPVLSQVVYCLYQAAETEYPDANAFKQVIRLAANHSGDSDSVAAIVGNVVGASWGQNALPKDWLDHLPLKNDLLNLGKVWTEAANCYKPTL